ALPISRRSASALSNPKWALQYVTMALLMRGSDSSSLAGSTPDRLRSALAAGIRSCTSPSYAVVLGLMRSATLTSSSRAIVHHLSGSGRRVPIGARRRSLTATASFVGGLLDEHHAVRIGQLAVSDHRR